MRNRGGLRDSRRMGGATSVTMHDVAPICRYVGISRKTCYKMEPVTAIRRQE
jgi:hypothetical protein